jgi:hypothetical protein
MKIKKIILTLALVSMAMALTACAKSSTTGAATDGTGANPADGGAVASATNDSGQDNNPRGDNPGAQRRRPDLYGQVEKIIGNEVTLKVAEMPARPARPEGAADGQQGQQGQQAQQGNALAGASATLGGGSGGQGGPPGGGMRGGGGGGWQGGGGMRGGGTTTIKYSGKTEKLIIPVGVPITSMKRAATGGAPTQAQLNISEITEGTMLQIYYAKAAPGEAKTIESVRVMQNQGQSQGGQSPAQGQGPGPGPGPGPERD